MSNQKNELLWRFNFYSNISQSTKNAFQEEFIFAFVEKNNWFCGGGVNMGMYDLDNNTPTKELKNSLISYLSNHHSIIESLTIQNYIESTDSFVEKETILIMQF
jgi:hypothetical protein